MAQLEFTRVDHALVHKAARVLELLGEKGLTVVTAESCTGGLVAAVLSEAPGAAKLLHGGFVTYTKRHKVEALGVSPELLARCGAVSRETACALVRGALERSPADLSLAATGVAGPEPDEDGKPVGLLHLACARRGNGSIVTVQRDLGDIGRGAFRYRAVAEALDLIRRAGTGSVIRAQAQMTERARR
jgi:nicotinamide-nucleotide amidase